MKSTSFLVIIIFTCDIEKITPCLERVDFFRDCFDSQRCHYVLSPFLRKKTYTFISVQIVASACTCQFSIHGLQPFETSDFTFNR